MRSHRRATRPAAALLAAAVALVSPGPGAYEALAQVLPVKVGVAPASSAAPLALSASPSSLAGPSSMAGVGTMSLSLGPVLPALRSPLLSRPAPADSAPLAAAEQVRAAAGAAKPGEPAREPPASLPRASAPSQTGQGGVLAPAAPSEKAPAPRPAEAVAVRAWKPETPAAGADAEEGGFRLGGRPLPKLQVHFKTLKAAFDLKQDAALLPRGMQDVGFTSVSGAELGPASAHQGGLSVAGAARADASAARTVPEPRIQRPGRGTAAMFILAFALAQVGLTCLGLSAPTLSVKLFGGYAMIALAYAGGSITGRQAAPFFIKRFGLDKTHLLTVAGKLLSIAALAGALAAGQLTFPLMLGLNVVYSLFHGVWATTTYAIPPAILGQEPGKLEKFWGINQFISFGLGVVVNVVAGAAIASYGFVPVLSSFPVAFALSMLAAAAAFRLARLPSNIRSPAGKPGEDPPRGFWADLTHGARVVWGTPALRSSMLAYMAFYFLTPLVFTTFAPLYGIRLMGEAELATGVSGFVAGFYQLGGLLAGLLLMVQSRRLKAKFKSLKERHPRLRGLGEDRWNARVDALERRVLKACLLRWMLYGTAALAGLATLALPLPALGALAGLPGWLSWTGNLTLPALALIPFGFAQNIVSIKLWSYFQSRIPDQKDVSPALGFMSAATLLLSTAGLLGLNALCAVLPGMLPFQLLALSLVPLGALYLYLRRALALSRDKLYPSG